MRGPDCERIDKGFLEEERESMGQAWFRLEYLCEFVDGAEAVFDPDLVEGALDDYLEPMEMGRQ